jgi:hypothetical protein
MLLLFAPGVPQEDARYFLATDAEGRLVGYTHFRCHTVKPFYHVSPAVTSDTL